jgi:hypothetical protein
MKFCKIGKGKQVHEVEWEGTYATYMTWCRLYTHDVVEHPGPATCKKCIAAAEWQQKKELETREPQSWGPYWDQDQPTGIYGDEATYFHSNR